MTHNDKKEFSETINISSNIKGNKNTIIGKFDLKDILFILIAGVVGIGVLCVLIVVLSIRNLFLILMVLALFEVPIITLGFLKLYNIPVLDYIKMKSKSDNKSYRKQVLRKKKSKKDKYIIIICLSDGLTKLEQVINDLYAIIQYENIEVKIIFDNIYLIIEVLDLSKVHYDKFLNYLINNKDIKYISNEDTKNFETYINSLKFNNKKYGKKQDKILMGNKLKLSKIKKVEETNDRYNYLTNFIIDAKDNEFIKVYKIMLYKSPFSINIFNELKVFCNITIHLNIENEHSENNISLLKISFVNTFLDIIGNEEEIKSNSVKVKEILDKYHILYKEINEEKVKDSLLFLVENKY